METHGSADDVEGDDEHHASHDTHAGEPSPRAHRRRYHRQEQTTLALAYHHDTHFHFGADNDPLGALPRECLW